MLHSAKEGVPRGRFFVTAAPKPSAETFFCLRGARRLRIPFSLFLQNKKGTLRVPFLFWRREGDSNPWYGDYRTHDFQSCSFGQLGHLSVNRCSLYQIVSKKSSPETEIFLTFFPTAGMFAYLYEKNDKLPILIDGNT